MEHRIGVGLIIGGVIASSIYIYQSDKFSKYQKAFLLICMILPPLQWASILIIHGINNFKKQKSPEALREKREIKETNGFDDQIQFLKELKDKEIITEQEYNDKVSRLVDSKKEFQIKTSEDYKKLKSLYEDGILTKEEFESKIEILKNLSVVKDENTSEEKEFFFEGLKVFVNEDLDYGFKDENDQVVINPIYEYADNFSNGLALVRDNGKFGFINKNGEIEIEMIYDNAEVFDNNKILVWLNNKKFFIDNKGKKIN